jgi:hypothetical protein
MVNDAAAVDVPLVVDMDGTLIKVDSLQEAFAQLLFRQPLQALRALLELKGGRAAFKAWVAAHVVPDAGTIPLEDSVVETIRQAKAKGRKVYLATAADRRFADLVATSVGHFDGVFASENGVNLKGRRKAEYIVQTFGRGGFDYIGNDAADIPVWREARTALISGASARDFQRYKTKVPGLISLNSRARAFADYVRVLRPQRWLKNVLVAIPALTALDFSAHTAEATLIAFLCFCFAASGVYVLNDCLDLQHDRGHFQKRHRPFAAGILQLRDGVWLAGLCMTLAAILSLALPVTSRFAVVAYIGGAVAYSLFARRIPGLDAIVLAALYGTRVWAGSAATDIALSLWVAILCAFVFLGMAFVRRSDEKSS